MLTIRQHFQAIEDITYSKYKTLLELPEEHVFDASARVWKIADALEDGIGIYKLAVLAGKLRHEEKLILAEIIRYFVADNIGNLCETYRYEGELDGEQLESYLDSLLMLSDALIYCPRKFEPSTITMYCPAATIL